MRRGMSLGTVLLALAVIGGLTLTVVAVAFQHYQFIGHFGDSQRAKNLAESAIAEALENVTVSASYGFGVARLPAESINVTVPDYPAGAVGLVTFNKPKAASWKVPWSTNNVAGNGAVSGDVGRSVPANVLHVVGTGRCGAARYCAEVLYYVPPYPNALASAGPVVSSGGLLVAGVRNPSLFTGNYDTLPSNARAPSHLISNDSSSQAIQLGPLCKINGNLAAQGGIGLDASDTVEGEVRAYGGPQPVPQIDFNQIFSQLQNTAAKEVMSGSVISGDYTTQFNVQCNGDLTVTGNLQLAGSLYVTGNLTVQGQLKGNGGVFVVGNTTIGQGASLLTGDQIAILSKGDLSLSGQDAGQYFFEGVIYAGGQVVARNITVLGAIISEGLQGIHLDNVNMILPPLQGIPISLQEMNQSDDDTSILVLEVESRDPNTRLPTSYLAQLWGTNDTGTRNTTLVATQSGLHSHADIQAWLTAHAGSVTQPADGGTDWSQDWFWTDLGSFRGQQHPEYTNDPLQFYMDVLSGTAPDPNHLLSINMDPSQVLGNVQRFRVLLWEEVRP